MSSPRVCVSLAVVMLLGCGGGTQAGDSPEETVGDDDEAPIDDGDDDEPTEPTPNEVDAPTEVVPDDAERVPDIVDPPAPVGEPEPTGEPEVIVEPEEEILAPGEDNPCERQIVFDSVVLSDPPPFDVVIVADHSDSLSWSREDLSRGLGELLSEVRGSEARFYVLTPTQYGADSAAVPPFNSSDFVPWRDPVTGEPYQDAMTSYTATCTDLAENPIECPEYEPLLEVEYILNGRFDFQMPGPIAAITKDMSAEEVLAQQQAIADEILSLGGGASYEQPMCTLARYVSQGAAKLPENVVFMLIADEDDNTVPNECLEGFTYQRRRNDSLTAGCITDCDLNRFRVETLADFESVSFACVPTDDMGVRHPELSYDISYSRGPLAEGCADTECDDADLLTAMNYCDAGDLVEDCSKTCRPDTAYSCSVDVIDTGIDACNESFEYNGTAYADVADYCTRRRELDGWVNCTETGYAVAEGEGSWTGAITPRMVAYGVETSDISDYFVRLAEQAFEENYVVEAIVHDPTFSCELGGGQSYGTNLSGLATEGDVFPICESYAPALSRVRGFAQELLQTQYEVELSDRETLEAIVITDQFGQERAVSEDDYSYDRDTSALTLNPEAVRPSDRNLAIEVALHCEPVAR